MKKIILTLCAVLTAGVVSAQTYPKQPDKTIVNYTSNYKGATVKKDEVKNDAYEDAVNEILDTSENEKAAAVKPVKNNTTASSDNRNKLATATTNKKQK